MYELRATYICRGKTHTIYMGESDSGNSGGL